MMKNIPIENYRIFSLKSRRFLKDGIVADIRFELNSENGYFACGNCWSSAINLSLIGKTSLIQLISEGWVPVPYEIKT